MTNETHEIDSYCSFCGDTKALNFKSKIANVFICINCVHHIKMQTGHNIKKNQKTINHKRIWDKI